MLKLRSFFQNIASCIKVKAASKKAYRNAAVFAVGSVIVAVVSFGSKDFGGSGKNVVFAAEAAETAGAEEMDSGECDTNSEAEAEVQIEISEETIQETHSLIGQTIEASVQVTERQPVISYTEKDYEALIRIVEAEAGICDMKGRILVANVVINRVKDKAFPNNIKDVVYQRTGRTYQFSPVKSGRIHRVKVTEETILAVEAALYGTDYSEGALFFAGRAKSNPNSMSWFDRKLDFLFEHDGHEFFKRK